MNRNLITAADLLMFTLGATVAMLLIDGWGWDGKVPILTYYMGAGWYLCMWLWDVWKETKKND